MEINICIGERLRKAREARGLSQTEFAQIAERAGVPGATRQSQAKYEKGLATPGASYLAAIAAAGVDTHYILTGEANHHVTGGRGGQAQELLDRALVAAPALRDERALTVASAVEADEARLVAAFRASDSAGRAAILIAADGVAALAKSAGNKKG